MPASRATPQPQSSAARPMTGTRPPFTPNGGARPPTNGGRSEDPMVAVAEHVQKGQWEAARTLLLGLTARHPTISRYHAMLAFVRGREAQLARRLDEARVELTHALQLDPDLDVAKTALAELFTRRK